MPIFSQSPSLGESTTSSGMSRRSLLKFWKSDNDLYDSLLKEEHSDDGSLSESEHQQPSRRRWLYAVLGHVALIMLYTVLSVIFIRTAIIESAPMKSAFPGLVVKYEFKKYDFFPNSSYIGEPGPENEKAWHDLMDSMAIRVTAEELAVHNQQSVPLPDGGYLAWLGVFHELHCVKLLRHWSWREHYPEFANLSAFEMAHNMVHIDHCLEVLRSAALCRADTEALSVFKWNDKSPKPIFNTKRVDHRCVNWDSLMASSYVDRVVTKDELDLLVNPLLEGDAEHRE